MSTCTLELDDVGFRYKGGHDALSNVSLRLERGIVGLLGPNGAGKSTLMRILATLAKPTRGRVQWGARTSRAAPIPCAALGYLPQDFGVYPMLSAREFLAYLGAVKGIAAQARGARVDEMPGRSAWRTSPTAASARSRAACGNASASRRRC